MDRSESQDATWLLLVAGGIAAVVVGKHVGGWLGAGESLARSALVPVLSGVGVGLVAVLLARCLVGRRLLAGRRRFVLAAADSFDPSVEAVRRFASGLERARPLWGGLVGARACAVRVLLDADGEDQMRYSVEVPARAVGALFTAASIYEGVELHEVTDEPHPAVNGGTGETVRAELVLARSSAEPLYAAGMDPDPLAGFAHALGELKAARGEHGVVCVDLLPVGAGAQRRLRRKLLRRAGLPRRDGLAQLLAQGSRSERRSPGELVERRIEGRALASKLGAPEPLFAIQVLVATTAPDRAAAKAGVHRLLTAFDVFNGENHFRVSGVRLPGGGSFLGADAPWHRRRFDRRLRSGWFAPARRRIVGTSEIAGLLKPPTARNPVPNVLRTGGLIPPPPPGLPTFHGQRGLLPLGRVSRNGERRLVGVPLDATFFSYMAGRSRYGKTETGVGQFVHLARAGHGCFFLDPHEDAIERIKRHLTDEGLRERVIEINLATRAERQPGWNLLAPQRRPVHQQVDALVDAFASTLGWDETNTRALNLTTQAAQALIELGRTLPLVLAPTLFQIPALLTNDAWRAAALPHVSAASREFFTERFPRLSPEAVTPVTNLIDRLRAAPPVAALFGNPSSSYDIRAAMDRGMVVLACPGDGTGRDRLIANFLVYDLLHAAKTRAELAPERRRPFWIFLDEVQTYDGATGGNLAALLEQTAKYGIRAFLFNQNPERLTPATLNAVTTNRSHLMTTALNAKAAGLLVREWAETIDPAVITRLHRYTFLASVTLNGRASAPFLLEGVSADELHEPEQDPAALGALDEAIDRTSGREPVADTLARLDEHDQRILDHLTAGKSPAQVGAVGPSQLTLGAEETADDGQ
jgi:hypothetical protein